MIQEQLVNFFGEDLLGAILVVSGFLIIFRFIFRFIFKALDEGLK